MIQVGLIPSRSLVTLSQDSEGRWIDIPEGEKVVPLIKNPSATTPGRVAHPKLTWYEDRVERDWDYIEKQQPVPASVTRAQLKLALIEAGLYQRTVDFVNTRANFPDEDTWKKVQVNWNDRLTFERQHPVVLMLMQALGISSDQADALWITAANL